MSQLSIYKLNNHTKFHIFFLNNSYKTKQTQNHFFSLFNARLSFVMLTFYYWLFTLHVNVFFPFISMINNKNLI